MRRLLLLASAISLSACVIRPVPSTNAPPPGPTTSTSATHEPTGEQHHPPPLPVAPPPARMLTCDDATRTAMQYAAEHQMGPMALQECHVEEDGRVLRVFLKGDKAESQHDKHDKRHLKMKVDARDGHVLEVKEDMRDKEDDEHGHGHGKGHEKHEHDDHDGDGD